MIERFPDIYPEFKGFIGFNFTDELPTGVTLASASASVTVLVGTDASAATMINGGAVIQGGQVLFPIVGRLQGVTYRFKIVAVTTHPAIVLVAAAPIKVI